MRRYVLTVVCLITSGVLLGAGNVFSTADSLFRTGENYKDCEQTLVKGLASATNSELKAEYCWRLSRVYLVLGEMESTKEGKRSVFGKGISYGEQGIAANPSNADCYMWHSANVGRECQTRKLMEQASKVPVMTNDLDMILNKLGQTEYSAAWQAYAEIYYNHPFKSNDAAINFVRKAAMCIPKGELRLSTYCFLAKLLYERNWSAAKRKATSDDNSAKVNAGKYKGNVEKYEMFDGVLGSASKPVWSKSSLGSLSDRQEAVAILDYALKLYKSSVNHSSIDNKDYKKISSLATEWK